MDEKTKRAVMQEMGRRGGIAGGRKGGKKSLENMTPEARVARAKKAAAASVKARAKKRASESKKKAAS